MAHKSLSGSLEFEGVSYDSTSSATMAHLHQALADAKAPFKGDFRLEVRVNDGVAEVHKNSSSGLTDVHKQQLAALEASLLKAAHGGPNGSKIKAEAEVEKE